VSKGKISGARALVQSLEHMHGDTIFGYPGGATLPIYDALSSRPIRHILARHEQGAAHMADGYSRASGKVGVCMATSGPGATNLVTGIATAYMDSSSVVAITGQVPRTMIGNDAFQEVDITGITIPITKHNYLVSEAGDIPWIVDEAFYLASSGRRGPVLIDIPKDVQNELFSPERVKRTPLEGYKPTVKGHAGQIKRLIQLLKRAERPLIIAGGGVAHADAQGALVAFVEKSGIPVVWTLMGKGGFPNSHPLNFGMLGYHGRVAANTAVNEADVICALGTRFGDRSTGPLENFIPHATVVHIDIDPAEISKNVPAHLPIVGDIRTTLESLEEKLERASHENWAAHLNSVAQRHPLKGKTEGVTIPSILIKLHELFPNPILVTDVGRHQIFAAHYFPVNRPRSFLTSGGLGTMGFGFPAALGAKIARPAEPVFCISGDGSFLMNCQEIVTAVEEKIPVVVLVMNDYCLGMIRQLQDAFYGKRYETCHFGRTTDFARLAESFGALGIRVEREEEIIPAIEKGAAEGGPVVIDCILQEPSNVYPMVTGKNLLEAIEEEK
jgi:acetolactate synthase I/II/III large subunit